VLQADAARPGGRARRSRTARQPGHRGAPRVPGRSRVTGAGRVYRVLLRAYPPAFRERFGAAMEQAFRDRYRAAAARGAAGVIALALRTGLDILVNAIAVRLHQRER